MYCSYPDLEYHRAPQGMHYYWLLSVYVCTLLYAHLLVAQRRYLLITEGQQSTHTHHSYRGRPYSCVRAYIMAVVLLSVTTQAFACKTCRKIFQKDLR